MQPLTKILLLSTAPATIAQSVPEPQSHGGVDPCTVLNKAHATGKISYQQVANCYHSIDYNATTAEMTLKSITYFFDNVNVFRDVAAMPADTWPVPFSLKPVDTMAVLKKVGRTKYRRDWDFHNDLGIFARSFQDAHLGYDAQCYTGYIFLQPLSLYAPVINGRQTIRVYRDAHKTGLEDCEVLTINGRPALSAIQDYADKHTGYSKDPGVRMNHALANFKYWPDAKTWLSAPGLFSLRPRLPDTPFIDYVLQCKDKMRRVRGEWDIVTPLAPDTFTDRATFVSNLCANSSGDEKKNVTSPPSGFSFRDDDKNDILTRVLALLYQREHGSVPDGSLKDLPNAKQVAGNGNTAAYQLKSLPHVGVLVVPSMELQSKTEIPAIQSHLHALTKNGVTHIIIDMTGNFGGLDEFASLLPSVFFTTNDTNKGEHKWRSHYRVFPDVQDLCEANLHQPNITTWWNPKDLWDMDGKPFTPARGHPLSFDKARNIAFGRRTALFSQPVQTDYHLEYLDPSMPSFPWSNDASKITILTDGQCGSACAETTDYFSRAHEVRVVAVGGHQGRPLSKFSYPGAEPIQLDDYVNSFEKLGLKAPVKRLPYASSAAVGLRMDYMREDTLPIEYNAGVFAADIHLDYSVETARSHDQLWVAVAKAAFK